MAQENLSTADLITHPVRGRILVALMGRELTTQQIARLLPDVPRATLYRQLRRLLDGGVVAVVREVPVRGTVEKVYAVPRHAAQIPAGDVADASPADHFRHFAAFQETMAACYRAYLEGDTLDPPSEVTMVATPLWLDDAEFQRFREALRALIRSFEGGGPGRGRRRVLWVAAIPDDRDAGPP